MASLLSTEGLASVSARHPWKTVGAWALILVLAAVYALGGLRDVVSTEMELTEDFESVVGMQMLTESDDLSDSANATETIVIRSLDGTSVDDTAFADHTNTVVTAVRQLQGDWAGEPPKGPPTPVDFISGNVQGANVLNYFELNQFGAPEIEQLVNADRTVIIVPVTFADAYGSVPISEYIDVVEQFDTDRFEVTSIGTLTINEEFSRVTTEDLIQGEMIGIPIATLVLVFVFGALVAPMLPLTLAVFSIGIALGVVTLIGQFEQLQLFIENMIAMLGLAIGIDYSLFIIERFREQRRLGHTTQRAIEIAGGTAGKAVFFSGMTVILALLGVMLVPINIFFSLSLGAVVVVAIAVLLTLTLLPALLSLLGDRINWPRKSRPEPTAYEHADIYSGFWGRIVRIVVSRPVVSLVAAVAVLLAMTWPIVDLRTGFTGTDQMPAGEIRDAYAVLEEDFSAGLLGPVEFVIEGERTDELDAALVDFQDRMEATGEFAPFSGTVRWNEEENLAVLVGTMTHPPSSDDAYSLIRDIRSDILPASIGQIDGVQTWVTGQSAIESDTLDMLGDRTPLVFVFVLTLSFILLTLAFRSIIVPLQAIVFNLLSVGATYGVLVLVFSKGFMRDLLGYNASPVVESWIPILLFCILFGLSMDYHVFILSRIREHYDISGNNSESVAIGLRTTGKIITGAAMIMVVVFGAFSTGRLLALQQLGFGLAVSVFLDATIVRSVLVPSIMTIVGDRNWWLPSWLNWLPDIRIEGEPPVPVQKESTQA